MCALLSDIQHLEAGRESLSEDFEANPSINDLLGPPEEIYDVAVFHVQPDRQEAKVLVELFKKTRLNCFNSEAGGAFAKTLLVSDKPPNNMSLFSYMAELSKRVGFVFVMLSPNLMRSNVVLSMLDTLQGRSDEEGATFDKLHVIPVHTCRDQRARTDRDRKYKMPLIFHGKPNYNIHNLLHHRTLLEMVGKHRGRVEGIRLRQEQERQQRYQQLLTEEQRIEARLLEHLNRPLSTADNPRLQARRETQPPSSAQPNVNTSTEPIVTIYEFPVDVPTRTTYIINANNVQIGSGNVIKNAIVPDALLGRTLYQLQDSLEASGLNLTDQQSSMNSNGLNLEAPDRQAVGLRSSQGPGQGDSRQRNRDVSTSTHAREIARLSVPSSSSFDLKKKQPNAENSAVQPSSAMSSENSSTSHSAASDRSAPASNNSGHTSGDAAPGSSCVCIETVQPSSDNGTISLHSRLSSSTSRSSPQDELGYLLINEAQSDTTNCSVPLPGLRPWIEVQSEATPNVAPAATGLTLDISAASSLRDTASSSQQFSQMTSLGDLPNDMPSFVSLDEQSSLRFQEHKEVTLESTQQLPDLLQELTVDDGSSGGSAEQVTVEGAPLPALVEGSLSQCKSSSQSEPEFSSEEESSDEWRSSEEQISSQKAYYTPEEAVIPALLMLSRSLN